ncbi:MAG: NifB/NifX family molybdenum-iron cluster-binding protein [Thermoplasmata archaeon]
MENDFTLSNKHFGDSNFFLILDIYENGDYKFLEKRKNTSLDTANEKIHGDVKKFRSLILLLNDVDILVAYRMGPNYLNIKNKTNKIPFLTRTDNFQESLEIIKLNFEKLWEDKIKKSI